MANIVPTSYGKFLKRLRVDTGDTLASMAGRLDVSLSLLTSIESGAREIPPELSDKIRKAYKLDPTASDALLKAELETKHKSILMGLGDKESDPEFREAALSISRDLQLLPLDEVKKIAKEVHEKAQQKRESEYNGWALALGGVAGIALGVGIALLAASGSKDQGGENPQGGK